MRLGANSPSTAIFQWRWVLDYSGGPVTDTYPHPLSPLLKALAPGMPKKVVAMLGTFVNAKPIGLGCRPAPC